jgi:hypothetical protein
VLRYQIGNVCWEFLAQQLLSSRRFQELNSAFSMFRGVLAKIRSPVLLYVRDKALRAGLETLHWNVAYLDIGE